MTKPSDNLFLEIDQSMYACTLLSVHINAQKGKSAPSVHRMLHACMCGMWGGGWGGVLVLKSGCMTMVFYDLCMRSS